MIEGGHFGEIPEVSEVPDLINLHNSCHFPHVPEVLERMPEGMPIVLEWISEARSEVGSAGSNYFGVLWHSRHFRHSRRAVHPLRANRLGCVWRYLNHNREI